MGSISPYEKRKRGRVLKKIDASLNEKLQNVEWGEYRIGDLFEIHSSKKIFHANAIDTIYDEKVEKSHPYVVRKTTDNGIRGYIVENEKYLNEANSITFAQDTFSVYYQKYEYYTGNKVKVLKPKYNNITEKSMIFLSGCIQNYLQNYSWGVGSTVETISEITFTLPTKNNRIDFEFMESFVAELEAQRLAELEAQRLAELEAYLTVTGLKDYKLNNDEIEVLNNIDKIIWKEFKMGDLFERVKTKKLPYKAKELPKEPIDNYTLPLLTSSFMNQGLNYYGPKINATILKNVISIPSNSDVYRSYYQSREFSVLSDAYAIEWKNKEIELSPNGYLFAVSCINKVTDLPIYSYKNKLGGWNVVKNKYIKLPVESNGEIDFNYMENLTQAIKKLVIKDVVKYADKKLETTKELLKYTT
ncbi:restriction endonuclease subunit S [Peptoniphilus sp. SGI.035]|uniref:restriction endonuclease subunit S n=1 Tax=Peptoniphilus sp. SGI.035 TaxID=3420564 RepID=UPI003D044E02